jgi:hypothetical protein
VAGGSRYKETLLPSSPPFLGLFFQQQQGVGVVPGGGADLRRRQQQHTLAQFMEGPFFRPVHLLQRILVDLRRKDNMSSS